MTHDIRNIIFDIGNVVVRWSPQTICEAAFGPGEGTPERIAGIFGDPLWRELNLGLRPAGDTMQMLGAKLGWDAELTDGFFGHILDSLDPLHDTLDLIDRLRGAGYRLFALTDNVHEIMAHLAPRYAFAERFEGIANSAEIGALKPDAAIYRHLLDTHALDAAHCLFLDDVEANVAGARAVGMHGIRFDHAAQAEADMRALGVLPATG